MSNDYIKLGADQARKLADKKRSSELPRIEAAIEKAASEGKYQTVVNFNACPGHVNFLVDALTTAGYAVKVLYADRPGENPCLDISWRR